MATTSSQTGTQSRPTRKRSTRKSTTGTRRTTTTRRTAATRRNARASTTTSTQPKTPVQQVQELAERAVLVPVGASLLARDNLVSTVKGLATKYRTRTGLERELKRFERRGASARNRFERTIKQNRRRIEREVKSVRKDLGKQSDLVGTRVEKLVSDAQSLLTPRF